MKKSKAKKFSFLPFYDRIVERMEKAGIDLDLSLEFEELVECRLLNLKLVWEIIGLLKKYKEKFPNEFYLWGQICFFTIGGIEVYPKNDKEAEMDLAKLYWDIMQYQYNLRDLEEIRLWYYDCMHCYGTVIMLTTDYRKEEDFLTSRDWTMRRPCNLYDAMHPVALENIDNPIEFIHI